MKLILRRELLGTPVVTRKIVSSWRLMAQQVIQALAGANAEESEVRIPAEQLIGQWTLQPGISRFSLPPFN